MRKVSDCPYTLVRNDMDVNKYERLFNITLRHQIMSRNSICIAILHFTVTIMGTG